MIRLAMLLLTLTAAQAQQAPPLPQASPDALPPSMPFRDANGDAIGTATIWQNRMYIRDPAGELIATIVVEADGSTTIYDPHGKVIDRAQLEKR